MSQTKMDRVFGSNSTTTSVDVHGSIVTKAIALLVSLDLLVVANAPSVASQCEVNGISTATLFRDGQNIVPAVADNKKKLFGDALQQSFGLFCSGQVGHVPESGESIVRHSFGQTVTDLLTDHLGRLFHRRFGKGSGCYGKTILDLRLLLGLGVSVSIFSLFGPPLPEIVFVSTASTVFVFAACTPRCFLVLPWLLRLGVSAIFSLFVPLLPEIAFVSTVSTEIVFVSTAYTVVVFAACTPRCSCRVA